MLAMVAGEVPVLFATLFVTIGQAECSPLNSSLRFLVTADWGGIPVFPYKTFRVMAVGYEMAQVASKTSADFVLALGDNFYFDGVKNVEDARFQQTFETVFSSPSLQIPWYVVAGNHDHYGNVTAQIAYSSKSKRWNFPDLYYKTNFAIPSSNSTVEILMLDTILLCGNTDRYDIYRQPVLDSTQGYLSEKQWTWIEENLKTSRASYLLVGGHFPVYSIAEHGSTTCLVNRLRPLLVKYNVTAYFCGHDHNMQHIREGYMDYFVSGSSDFIDPSKRHIGSIPPESLLFHWGNPFSLGAFLSVEISESKMIVSYVQSAGNVMYKFSKPPRECA